MSFRQLYKEYCSINSSNGQGPMEWGAKCVNLLQWNQDPAVWLIFSKLSSLQNEKLEQNLFLDCGNELTIQGAVTAMQLCEHETKSGFMATKRSTRTTKKKKKVICARCQKTGHKSPDCRAPTPVSKGNLAQTESDSDDSTSFTAVYYGNLSHEEETASSTTHVTNISQSPETEIYWIVSGASEHISNNRDHFTDFRPTSGYISGIASGVMVNGKGTVVLSKGHKTVTLKDVLYAPQCPSNLIAINKAVLAGKEIKISNKKL
ncbi:hypothetical protein KL928_001437, partial [Ogataea angusta]